MNCQKKAAGIIRIQRKHSFTEGVKKTFNGHGRGQGGGVSRKKNGIFIVFLHDSGHSGYAEPWYKHFFHVPSLSPPPHKDFYCFMFS